MQGAWSGLQHMHDTLKMLHYDIKPANVLIDMVPSHHGNGNGIEYTGVLGDIDEAVARDQCERWFGKPVVDEKGNEATLYVMSTPCYGAPFKHCDPRRDQVALLLTTLEFFSGESWFDHCEERNITNEEGFDPGVQTGKLQKAYGSYADLLRMNTVTTKEAKRDLEFFPGLLQALEPDPVTSAAWRDDGSLYNRIQSQFLRQWVIRHPSLRFRVPKGAPIPEEK